MRKKNRKVILGLGILSILILVLYILLMKHDINQNQVTVTEGNQEIITNEDINNPNETKTPDKNKIEENQSEVMGEAKQGEETQGEETQGEETQGEETQGEETQGETVLTDSSMNKETPESLPALTIIDTTNIGEHFMEDYFIQYEISPKIYDRIYGISYKMDCPLPIEELRYLTVLYYGFDQETHIGEMIVNKSIAKDVIQIFKELYEQNIQSKKCSLLTNIMGTIFFL